MNNIKTPLIFNGIGPAAASSHPITFMGDVVFKWRRRGLEYVQAYKQNGKWCNRKSISRQVEGKPVSVILSNDKFERFIGLESTTPDFIIYELSLGHFSGDIIYSDEFFELSKPDTDQRCIATSLGPHTGQKGLSYYIWECIGWRFAEAKDYATK